MFEKVPHGHWCTTTMLSEIRLDGVIESASLVYDGSTDAALFLTYGQDCLAPALRPGDVVVMDNRSSHKVQGVREAIEAVGVDVWYLPSYSPDLNPIEMSPPTRYHQSIRAHHLISTSKQHAP